MDEQNAQAAASAEPAGPVAAAPGPAGLAVIHPKGGEPPGSLVTGRAPPPGAPLQHGQPVARPAPPSGPSQVIRPAAEEPSDRARLATLEAIVNEQGAMLSELERRIAAFDDPTRRISALEGTVSDFFKSDAPRSLEPANDDAPASGGCGQDAYPGAAGEPGAIDGSEIIGGPVGSAMTTAAVEDLTADPAAPAPEGDGI